MQCVLCRTNVNYNRDYDTSRFRRNTLAPLILLQYRGLDTILLLLRKITQLPLILLKSQNN